MTSNATAHMVSDNICTGHRIRRALLGSLGCRSFTPKEVLVTAETHHKCLNSSFPAIRTIECVDKPCAPSPPMSYAHLGRQSLFLSIYSSCWDESWLMMPRRGLLITYRSLQDRDSANRHAWKRTGKNNNNLFEPWMLFLDLSSL